MLSTVVLNSLKDKGEIEDFKGSKEKAKIKKPGAKSYTKAVSKTNENFLKKKFNQNPELFGVKEEKPEEKPEEELKDKPSDIARQKAEAEAKARAEIARQKAKEEAEAKARAEEENHPINKLARRVAKERNPVRKKTLLRQLRELDAKTNNADKPKKYVNMKGVLSKAKNSRDSFQKTFLKKKDNRIDKLSVSTPSFMEDVEERIRPTQENQALLYFIAAAVNRAPEKVISGYIADPLAFLTELRTDFNQDLDEQDREMYNRMSEQKINYSDITPKYIETFQREVNREQMDADAKKAREAKEAEPQFGLPEGAPRQALQEEASRLVEVAPSSAITGGVPPETALRRRRDVAIDVSDLSDLLQNANTDDEKRERIDDWITVNGARLQRAGQTGADVIRMISQIPALRNKKVWIPIIAAIVAGSAYYATSGTEELQETPASLELPAPSVEAKAEKPALLELPAPPIKEAETQIDETDPVKVEAELRRLREQLTNLRTSKLNEKQEEQPFKKLRKFRPEIREFNPERLNYFISAENEELEKKELIEFAYIPEVSQAGVYTEDYKDNPIVMGNIQNENIRFSNTKKQPMDYHPVGTYMLLDRIGKQMSEIRRDFDKAVASMRHQRQADDDMFNQVFIPRIPPVEYPRNRRYRDMGDPVGKFASEPIVSLPKIDDRGVGATNAHRDFTTSYSYRRHYIK